MADLQMKEILERMAPLSIDNAVINSYQDPNMIVERDVERTYSVIKYE